MSTFLSDQPAHATLPNSPELDELPLTSFERSLLGHDTAETPAVFRVLMRFDGPVDRTALTQAFQTAIARQPLLLSRIAGTGMQRVWKRIGTLPVLLWQPPGLTADQISRLEVDPIDIATSCGLRARIWEIEGGITILLDFHHACCDGQGARQFIGEWFGLYEQLLKHEPLQLAPQEPERLKQRGYYRQPHEPIGLFEGLRNLYLTLKGRTVLLPLRKESLPGEQLSNIGERPLSIEQTSLLRSNLKANRLTLNDVGLAASITTFASRYPEVAHRGYITVLHPIDLRWPSDLKTPACNRVGLTFIRRRIRDCRDLTGLLNSLREQMQYIKHRYVGAEFLRGLDLAEGIPGVLPTLERWGWFRPTLQFTCLGDTTRAIHYRFPLNDGVIDFHGLRLNRISGFMQLGPYVPVSIAACETNQRLTLTVRSNPRYVTADENERFADLFVEQLLHFSSLSGE